LSGLYIAGLPGGPAVSWAANKLWLACQEVLQQDFQTSSEAIVLRCGLRQGVEFCTGFGWDRNNFLHSSLYGAMFWI